MNGMTYVPENFLEEILIEMEKASSGTVAKAKSKLERKTPNISPPNEIASVESERLLQRWY